MKKMNFLKILMTLVLVFAMSGVFAQVVDSDYSEYDPDRLTPTNVEYLTLRTGGTTVMGYYALPDPIYSPDYNAVGGWALAAGFSWNWTIPTNPGAAASVSGGGVPANYVELTYTATGDYTVNVAEQSSAAMGSCPDASPTVMSVTVIAPPTSTITTADITNFCGDQPVETINIRIVENIGNTLAAYAFNVQEVVENIDAGGAPIGAPLSTTTDFVEFTMAAKGQANVTAGWTAATPNFDYDFDSSPLTVQTSLRTRYTYTLTKATDAPAAASHGLISAITEKSDYIAVAGGADYLTYAFTDNTVVFIVNPAPATGPIYHISNTFAY